MKTFFTLLSASAIIFVACNQNKPKETSDTADGVSKAVKECYLATSGKDSASMSIDNANGEVIGTLGFNFLEKDDANGEIKGKFTGDTLFVDYTFQAEGTTSKNPLVFLKTGSNFQQGYGEITTYLGKTYFKDHSAIKFSEGFLFKPVDCK